MTPLAGPLGAFTPPGPAPPALAARPFDRRRCLEALTASAFNLATAIDRVLAH